MERKTLREVCTLVGVTRRAVQGYEQAGLVAPVDKNKYGHLLYDEVAIETIRTIKQYQDFGFTVKKIKILFEAPLEDYVTMMTNRMEVMQAELQALAANIRKVEELIREKQQ